MGANIAIIILNWNGWEDTIECLESVFQLDYLNYHVILVDNNSDDQSLEKIKLYCCGELTAESKYVRYNKSNKPVTYSEYTKQETEVDNVAVGEQIKSLTLIKNDKNYGFAEGNNIGIRYALKVFAPDYILLLNNDVVVDKNLLTHLASFADENEHIGIVGPRILYYNSGQIQSLGVKINFWTGNVKYIGHNEKDKPCDHNTFIDVDYVFGACFLIKRSVIEKIGLLDPIYFLYTEEADWSLRAKSNGFHSCCYLKTHIWHKSQASTSKVIEYCYYYPIRNQIILLRRYAPKHTLIISLTYFIISVSTIILLVSIKKRNISRLKYCISAIRDGLAKTYS